MTTPVITQLNLVAGDFAASVAFYRKLGLNIVERSAPDLGHRHAEITLPNGFLLEIDNQELAATYHGGWRGSPGDRRSIIGFSLPTREEVDRVYSELTASGYQGRQRPYDAFWGARYAIVADPDGNEIGFMGPIEEERRSWPPGEPPTR